MCNINRYDKGDEPELIRLLKADGDWDSFTCADSLDSFKNALVNSETLVCKTRNKVCGYLRAIVDGFGVYISELYVAPRYRGRGYARGMLHQIKSAHPDEDVYVLSDEDRYYEKLGYKRVGSVFRL